MLLVAGLYVLYESVHLLIGRIPQSPACIGIVLAALSLIVMPWLAALKAEVATSLESGALEAETRRLRFVLTSRRYCCLGLVERMVRLVWADPLAALGMCLSSMGGMGSNSRPHCCAGEAISV